MAPILAILGLQFCNFLGETIAWFPHHLLSVVFCAVTAILYPLVIFENKAVKRAGVIIAVIILVAGTVFTVMNDNDFYNATILISQDSGEGYFDDTYTVSFEDEGYGNVYIIYMEQFECYAVNAEFNKPGTTKLILTSPEGKETVYELVINKNTYTIEKISSRQ